MSCNTFLDLTSAIGQSKVRIMAEGQAIEILIAEAMKGRQEAVSELAQRVTGRVSAYMYRVTLSRDLSEDLSQEAMLTMVRSLSGLRDPNRFWPWLYRIAQSKVQEHFRSKQRHPAAPDQETYGEFVSRRANPHEYDALHRVAHKELVRKVVVAMRRLSRQYRAVLSLRCFEQLSFADIGVSLGCSDVKARVMFYRAKKALEKQLAHEGVRKGMFLLCLGLFGKATAPADAATGTATVTAASMKVGLTAAMLATVTTKVGVTAAVAISLAAVTMGGVSVLYDSSMPKRSEVSSLHFTTQLRFSEPDAPPSLSKGAYEQSYYFPDGIDGPAFFRMQRWDPQQQKKLCSWLQDAQANYYYHSGKRTLYLKNERVAWSSLRVQRLPTDDAGLTDFLSGVEGGLGRVAFHRNRRTGLLTGAVDDRFVGVPHFRTTYEYNGLDEDAFEPDWPAQTPVVDERDPMHRRGWAFFRIEGRVHDRPVSGRGRVPFFYNASKENPAWLDLRVGEGIRIADGNGIARVENNNGQITAVYPPGSFFAGLPRPWMGLHSIDTIRRDAAKQRIRFKTEISKDRSHATVTLTHPVNQTVIRLDYDVDMNTDVVDQIGLRVNDRPVGVLTFSYMQELDTATSEFTVPGLPAEPPGRVTESPGILWLVSLAQGQLGAE